MTSTSSTASAQEAKAPLHPDKAACLPLSVIADANRIEVMTSDKHH